MPLRLRDLPDAEKAAARAGLSTGVGDEGGFAPICPRARAASELILEAIDRAGHSGDVALDPSPSGLFSDGIYHLRGEGRELDTAAMIDMYADFANRYPLVSLEDGLAEDEWEGWQQLTERLADRLQLVGDDIFVLASNASSVASTSTLPIRC